VVEEEDLISGRSSRFLDIGGVGGSDDGCITRESCSSVETEKGPIVSVGLSKGLSGLKSSLPIVGLASLISSNGTPSTESRELNTACRPRPALALGGCCGFRPDQRRLACRATLPITEGVCKLDEDSRAAFRRCRSAISHCLRVYSLC
jgi:hypothetical protein